MKVAILTMTFLAALGSPQAQAETVPFSEVRFMLESYESVSPPSLGCELRELAPAHAVEIELERVPYTELDVGEWKLESPGPESWSASIIVFLLPEAGVPTYTITASVGPTQVDQEKHESITIEVPRLQDRKPFFLRGNTEEVQQEDRTWFLTPILEVKP